MKRAQSLSDACSQERLMRSRISGAKAQANNLRQKKRTVSEQVRWWLRCYYRLFVFRCASLKPL